MTKQGIIGKDNSLPWSLPADLKRFKEITMGQPIIMGRKTFESIGRPLPGRKNIVMSSNKDLNLPKEVSVVASLSAALELAKKFTGLERDEVFVIGGSQAFKEALPLCTKLYVTWIEKDFVGNVYFPDFEISQFSEHEKESFIAPFPHTYAVYKKISQ